MKDSVSVVGLGYVGLPLAVAAAKSGYKVTGIDLDEIKVSEINKGISQIEDIDNVELTDLVKTAKFKAESNYASIDSAEIVLVCVPTPLLDNHLPDLSYLESVARSIKGKLTQGALLILESTVAPGTTRDFFAPLLEFNFDQPEKNFKIAYSPERIDPMNKNWTIKNTPKVVAGLTKEAKDMAVNFYSKFIDEVIHCESIEVAETAKLLENSFRYQWWLKS